MIRPESFLDGRVTLWGGDCLKRLPKLAENSIDSGVCDPPYHLTSIVKRFGANNAAPAKRGKTGAYARASAGFMGKQWDGGDIAFRPEIWRAVLRVFKPGAHLIAFGGTRTYHRMACAIEDAGFEIRDCIQWLYGSGFPKSHDVGKGIDRAAGAERSLVALGKPVKRIIPGADQNKAGWEKTNGRVYVPGRRPPVTEEAQRWDGWGTALKPACELIVLARKPLDGTVAANVLKWGTGALNINGCRIMVDDEAYAKNCSGDRGHADNRSRNMDFAMGCGTASDLGRWPANVITDGSKEVVGLFPDNLTSGTGAVKRETGEGYQANAYGKESRSVGTPNVEYGDTGSAARFFYTSKADSDDRLGSKHPTVKPLDLMQYLVRLVTPPRGLVLDPFAGTGTTGEAAWREGMRAVLIEREAEYQDDIRRRMKLALAGPDERARESIKATLKDTPADPGPLFGGSS
jgi:site-specific DNA-methyltransferase (adenine-specific)